MFLDYSTIYHAYMTWYDLPFTRMKKENIQREVFMLAKKSKDVNDRLRSSRARSLALYYIPENIVRIIRSCAITPSHRASARLDTHAPSLIIFLYFPSIQELHWVGSRKVLIVAFKVVINPP